MTRRVEGHVARRYDACLGWACSSYMCEEPRGTPRLWLCSAIAETRTAMLRTGACVVVHACSMESNLRTARPLLEAPVGTLCTP